MDWKYEKHLKQAAKHSEYKCLRNINWESGGILLSTELTMANYLISDVKERNIPNELC